MTSIAAPLRREITFEGHWCNSCSYRGIRLGTSSATPNVCLLFGDGVRAVAELFHDDKGELLRCSACLAWEIENAPVPPPRKARA